MGEHQQKWCACVCGREIQAKKVQSPVRLDRRLFCLSTFSRYLRIETHTHKQNPEFERV